MVMLFVLGLTMGFGLAVHFQIKRTIKRAEKEHR